MRNLALSATLLGLLALPAYAADPLVGTWQTKPDDNGNFGYVQVTPCGARFCGTLIKSFDGKGKPTKSDNIGKKLIWDMKAEGGGKYDDGKIWAPDRDKTYDSKLQLTGDKLAVSGCILGGFICRNGGTWTRVK